MVIKVARVAKDIGENVAVYNCTLLNAPLGSLSLTAKIFQLLENGGKSFYLANGKGVK